MVYFASQDDLTETNKRLELSRFAQVCADPHWIIQQNLTKYRRHHRVSTLFASLYVIPDLALLVADYAMTLDIFEYRCCIDDIEEVD